MKSGRERKLKALLHVFDQLQDFQRRTGIEVLNPQKQFRLVSKIAKGLGIKGIKLKPLNIYEIG